MQYRAVNGRCAVDLSELPIQGYQAVEALRRLGFGVRGAQPVLWARSHVGVARYQRGARMADAPAIFDCSSFTKYLYGLMGIWLPRRAIQQRAAGRPVEVGDLRAGDLVFLAGRQGFYDTDPNDAVGHVLIATGEGTAIHAANADCGVVEQALSDCLDDPGKFRGIRRWLPDGDFRVLAIPPELEVETSDDIRWLLLRGLQT